MKNKTRKKTARKTSTKARRKTRIATPHGPVVIENGLGGMKTARAIAKALKQAADASDNLSTAPFHAAMAALDHLISFLDRQRERLEAAKDELRRLYGDTEPNRRVRRDDTAPARPRKRGLKAAAA
jgi:hypothetical protein